MKRIMAGPDEGDRLAGVSLVVAGEPAVAADPRERALQDPALQQHDEAVSVASAHDLQGPRPSAGYGDRYSRSLVVRDQDDALDEAEEPSCLAQYM